MEPIYFKGGGYNLLSNMSAYAIDWRGELWMTVEHAFQAAKFSDHKIVEEIRDARSGFDARMLGQKYSEHKDPKWNDKSLEIMEELLRLKIEQHPHVREKLLASGGSDLVEDTDDAFYGRGPDGKGENQLGKLWMKLRSELGVQLLF